MDRPSNRSSSPLSTRTNPNLRKSESNSDVRRSFTGNPFGGRPSGLTNPRFVNPITPANSPADHLRRHSLGKEGTGFNPRVHDEKENKKAAKGSKHFMSPTISAASKFTPSPRKNVLAERNEIVRTSIQFSDFQSPDLMEDSCVKSGKISDQVRAEGSFDSKVDQKEVIVEVPTVVPQVTLDSEMNENSDCLSFTKKKVSFSDNSPIIKAPLDADPSQPPYDPETNFLSPRPQFLRYRPNPRIEVFLNKENGEVFGECGGMRLEDSFILSDESQSEDSPKESEDLSSSDTISKEGGESIVSESNLTMSEESQSEGEIIISEPMPINTPISNPTPEPILELKRSPKSRFFKRAISISLLMVFVIACVSLCVSNSPIINSPVLKDFRLSSLYDSSEVVAYARSNLNELARNFRQWTANSVSYLSDLVPHISQSYEMGPIQFANLTDFASQEDLSVDQEEEEWGVVAYAKSNLNELARNFRQWTANSVSYLSDLVPHISQSYEMGPIQFANLTDFASQEDLLVDQEEEEWGMVSEEKEEEEEELEYASNVEDQPILEQLAEILAEEESVDIIPETELSKFELEQEVCDVSPVLVTADLNSHAEIEPAVEDIKLELFSEIETAPSEPLQSTNEYETNVELSSTIAPSAAEPIPSTLNAAADNRFSVQNILGVFLFVFSLAATIFMYRKPRKSGVSRDLTQKMSKEAVVSKQVPQSWETNEEAQSFASEMSGFQKSSSYNKGGLRKETSEEAQSHEKRGWTNNKRESLASSSSEFSMGSLSYGSFTTYEKIPIKKAYGEEEIVTPVRRSSRIRSHITSP